MLVKESIDRKKSARSFCRSKQKFANFSSAIFPVSLENSHNISLWQQLIDFASLFSSWLESTHRWLRHSCLITVTIVSTDLTTPKLMLDYQTMASSVWELKDGTSATESWLVVCTMLTVTTSCLLKWFSTRNQCLTTTPTTHSLMSNGISMQRKATWFSS